MLRNVVIVGRPNVGKSTLFNRLSGKRRALIHDLPGMTRDRLSDVVELEGRRFRLTDTGGLEYGDDPLSAFATEIKQQATLAMDEADLILFVVDGAAGRTGEDSEIARDLRSRAKQVVLLVNKIDTRSAKENESDFHRLGFERVLPISAEHGSGMEDLHDLIIDAVPQTTEEEEQEEAELAAPLRVAIIGRPNVGKSSLLNRLLGEQRMVVSPISGTTRDAIDSIVERNGKQYVLIDTAGIRRKGKTTDEAEKLAVISARKAIARCDIALVMIDATEGITAQDATVAGYAEEEGKAAILLVNKWDMAESSPTYAKEFESLTRRRLRFLDYAPLEFISAKSGRRVEKIFDRVDEVAACYRVRIKTSVLNEILEHAVAAHHAPTVKGKPRRFYYATQLKTAPPTIALFSNVSEPLHFSYERFLQNRFREALKLVGTPIHFIVRARQGMKRDDKRGTKRDEKRGTKPKEKRGTKPDEKRGTKRDDKRSGR